MKHLSVLRAILRVVLLMYLFLRITNGKLVNFFIILQGFADIFEHIGDSTGTRFAFADRLARPTSILVGRTSARFLELLNDVGDIYATAQ